MQSTQRYFEQSKVIDYYTHVSELTTAEAIILRDFRADFVNKRVLDLGIGAGRTVPSLAPLAACYVGIDYSLGMIQRCKARFPHYRIEHGDARDLSRFAPGSFDTVLFSVNGLDCVGHADRLTILAEAARVLVTGGIFMFSSHSLHWRSRQPFWKNLVHTDVPKTVLQAVKQVARAGTTLANHIRHSHLQERSTGYAILLDPAHGFSLPVYHVCPAEQTRQLREAGFDDPKIIGEAGFDDPGISPAHHGDHYDQERSYAFYYLARGLKP